MKTPRNLSGDELIRLLARYGYVVSRQRKHTRLTSTVTGQEHHITVPRHDRLKVGTLDGILSDVAGYLGKTKEDLLEELFG